MLQVYKFWQGLFKGCLTFCILLFVTQANALVIIQDASIGFGTDLDSNPTMSENKQSIWRYSATPKYNINAYDNLNKWYSNISLRLQRSSDKKVAVDREDPTIILGWERENDKGRFTLFANYNKDSTRFTEFDGTGLVVDDGSSIKRTLGANWQHFLTERVNLTLGGQYLKTDFTGGGDFTDYETKSINSSLSYTWSEKISPFFQFSHTEFDTDRVGSKVTKSQSYLIGANFIVSPRFNLNAGYGITHVSTSGNGENANASFNYFGERYQLRGALSRTVSPSSIGNFQESDRLSLGYGYDLTDKSRFGTDFTWRINNTLNNVKTKQLNSFYARDLSEFWQMRVLLQLRNLESNNRNANGETVGVSLTYNTPEF